MSEFVWFRSYVEQVLRQIWEVDQVVTDADGDYPSRYGTAAVWVRVEAQEPMAVRVMSHAAFKVQRSAELLDELHDITARARFGSVYWARGAVVVEYALPAGAVNPETLAEACSVVGTRADDIGLMITALYGGRVPFPPKASHELQPGEDAA
jgi:hypothetical protein